jgi:hypothetical protein
LKPGDAFVDALLYTEGILKGREYRIHINKWSGVFAIQQKKRRNGIENDNLIRSHKSGWVYTNNITPIPQVITESMERTLCQILTWIGLDFGAFDVIVKNDVMYILEVNTAPGLKSPTLIEQYRKQFALDNEDLDYYIGHR